MAIQKGDKAPGFKLLGTDTKEIQLSDYQGKNLVLLFFPLAYTGVCTTELCTMRDELETYNNLNAEVLAVSVDSPMVLDKYKSDNNFNFPLASDFNAEACASFDSKYDEFVLGMKNVAKRSAFVIDGSGTVQYAEVLDSAGDLPSFENIQSTLNNLG